MVLLPSSHHTGQVSEVEAHRWSEDVARVERWVHVTLTQPVALYLQAATGPGLWDWLDKKVKMKFTDLTTMHRKHKFFEFQLQTHALLYCPSTEITAVTLLFVCNHVTFRLLIHSQYQRRRPSQVRLRRHLGENIVHLTKGNCSHF